MLSLSASFCNPVLLYCLEAMHLNKTDINSLTYPFNSVYMKIFSTFNDAVITQCQFYCAQLPLSYQVDLRTLNFLDKLSNYDCNSPASILFKLFGLTKRNIIQAKHSILGTNNRSCIYNSFTTYAVSQQ